MKRNITRRAFLVLCVVVVGVLVSTVGGAVEDLGAAMCAVVVVTIGGARSNVRQRDISLSIVDFSLGQSLQSWAKVSVKRRQVFLGRFAISQTSAFYQRHTLDTLPHHTTRVQGGPPRSDRATSLVSNRARKEKRVRHNTLCVCKINKKTIKKCVISHQTAM